MIRPPLLGVGGRLLPLCRQSSPLGLNRLAPGSGPWEVELGFGKGRFLLSQARQRPGVRFVGIESSQTYFKLAYRRASRRGLDRLVLLRGEALHLLATYLPTAFAQALHVYFPDPWPKSRHHKRRLFTAESLDLVLSPLQPGGTLYFATDHTDYGDEVHELVRLHPRLEVKRRQSPWAEGARTNYEAKYVAEGRSILRLEVRLQVGDRSELLHPQGRMGVVAAVSGRRAVQSAE